MGVGLLDNTAEMDRELEEMCEGGRRVCVCGWMGGWGGG